MSKKVIKSSNKNEKYNLKSVLDTDNIISGVSLKTVTAIGCASIIASCGNDKPKDDGNKEKDTNKLKWDDIQEYQSKFGNNEKKFNEFLAKCKNLSEDEIKNLIKGIKTEDIDEIIKSKEELKLDNGTFKLGNEVVNVKEEEPKGNETLSFEKLTNEQKKTLKTYGITNQETLDEFFKIPDNEGFKNKKISELFNEKDIKDETLKNKLEAYKNSKEDNEVKEILKLIMSDADIKSFLNYVKYINDKLENIQNLTFNDIKANKGKEKELKDKIKKFCEKYVKSENKINYEEISKIKNIILINSIKEDIKAKLEEGQNVDNLTFTYSKGDNCIKLKIVHKDDKNKSVELEIQFESEELLKLKEKEDKEIQLYRIKDGEEGIKYNIDDTKTTEIKNLFPKKKDETAMNKIKATIKSELEKSLKDNNNDVKIDSFVNVAKVLKSLITTAKKLNTGKINANGNDEWIYENVSSVNDLDALFGGTQGEYVKAVTAEYDAIIKKINDDLGKVTSGELASNAKEKKEYKMTETIESATIKATINGHFKEGATKLVEYIPTLLTNTQKAKIEFDDNYEVVTIQLPSGFEVVTGNVLEYGSNGNAADASKTDALTALKAELKKVLENICKNSFGKDKLDSGKNVKNKDEIKNYIDTELTYDKVKTLDDAKINGLEATLKDKCGFNIKTLTTKAQIETDIVEPLLAKVFGDKNKCKAVFTNLEALATTTVQQGANVKLNTKSLASIQNASGNTATVKIDGTKEPTHFLTVFTAIKSNIKNVSNAVNAVISESDPNKKASDAFIKALKTIIGVPGKDNGVANSEHLSLAFNNKASLLFKWMYVSGDKWNDPDAGGKNHHDAAIASFVNVLACFLNKNASYKGVADPNNKVQGNQIVWNDNTGGAGGTTSTLLYNNTGIPAQLKAKVTVDYALMIEKAKQVKIYFSDTLVPNTYADITVSALTTSGGGGAANFVKDSDILIDPNAAQKPQMYYIFQLVGGHDKYEHTILGKKQELSGALKG